MGKPMRLVALFLVVCVLNAYAVPAVLLAQDAAPASPEGKVTTVDPQFVPLSEPQSIEKPGLKWYWYLLGLAVIGGGIAAAAAAGGKDSTTTTTAPTTGSVTGTW